MKRRSWPTLAVVTTATAMLLFDVTVVYIALPTIQRDLGATFAQMQWVIDAYTVTLAATLLGAGALADRLGRRRVFLFGLGIFSAFSALCGLASSALLLNLARAAQGIGAAAMFARSLALLAHEFQGAERGFAVGVWGSVTGAALAIGPLLGGVVVDAFSWRWIFLVNVPVGALLLVVTGRVVSESKNERPAPLDVGGMALFAAVCSLAVTALVRFRPGSGKLPGVLLATSFALLLAFVAVERRAPAPMLPLAFFRHRAFAGTAFVAFAQSVAIYPQLLFLAVYFQEALHLSPTGAGLRMLPMTLPIFFVAPLSGRLLVRFPLRLPFTGGLALFVAATLLMRGVEVTDGWTRLLPGMLVSGVGIEMISPALAAAMVSVPPVEHSGVSSGINNTFRQVGISVGIAGLGALFESYRSPDIGVADGIVAGFNAVFLVAAVVAFCAAVACWFLLGDQRASGAHPELAHEV